MSLSQWFSQTRSLRSQKRTRSALENVRRRGRRSEIRRILVEALEPRHMMASDFGDAPDTGLGTGLGNYETLLANNGPRHVIDTTALTLFMGNSVDSEADATPSTSANSDDLFITPAKDDEEGLIEAEQDLKLAVGSAPQVRVVASNLTASSATLYGWIDVNRDGVFDNVNERASAVVGIGTNKGTFTLTFPTIPSSTTPGATYARFRLSTDVAAANAVGNANDGEVEDYRASINTLSEVAVNNAKTVKVASGLNGGPVLTNANEFGASIANIGDIDGDGVVDMASNRTNSRVVVTMLMNSNGTVKSSLFIGNSLNGGPALNPGDLWALSVGALGDLDGDGIGELVVGGFDNYANNGMIHVLFLNSTGAAKSSIQIRSGLNGGPATAAQDNFGFSVTSIGDIDLDGIPDLAVGARRDNTGANQNGAIYILRMNANGSVKNNTKIASGLNGGPVLLGGDNFGRSVASIGDIDGNGVTDIAVGAPFDTLDANSLGAVHVLLMNANGTVNSSVRISKNANGGPNLDNDTQFGSSVASIGDLDGDGITEIAVGAETDSTGGILRGAVHILYLGADGKAKRSGKLAHQLNGGPTLVDQDFFGSAVASLGDLDLDGRLDLAIGAKGDDTGGANVNRGAIYVSYLTPDAISPTFSSIVRQSPLNSATNSDTLVFRATFSEDVINVDATDFSIHGTTTATITAVTQISPLIYDLTVSGGNLASFNGTVGINLANIQNLTDRTGNALANGEPPIDQVYLLDNVAPVLLSFARWLPTANQTSADAVRFRANFSEPVVNVDVTDFIVTGTTATITTLTVVNSQTYELTLSGGDLPTLVGTVGLNVAGGQNIVDLVGNALANSEPAIDETYSLVAATNLDFGDAPDTGLGTGTGNYKTSSADNGPRHTIVAGLKLGIYTESEVDGAGDSLALDDDRFIVAADHDDEDGMSEPAIDMLLTAGAAPQARLRATNTTGNAATLYGWIDINQDGVFDNGTERTSVAVPNATNNATFTLTFPVIPTTHAGGRTYARFRLSTDAAAANSFGAATDGEVEDYSAMVTKQSVSTFDSAKTVKIAHETNGGPTLVNSDIFGTAMTAIGDLDGDGISEIAVGADADDTGGANRGAVYIQFLNANGTVKRQTKIASGLNGFPILANTDNFGSGIARLGDLDGDGVTEIVVGARNDDTGGTNRGSVYTVFLRPDGTVKSSIEIGSGLNGGPILLDTSGFGSSIANIGDLNGDGTNDIAVGANLYAGRGSVFILFMNANGTAASSVETLDGSLVATGSTAGDGVYSVGDLDNDGVTDIAVGDRGYDTIGTNQGAVSIVFLLPTGLPKLPIKTIASGVNGGPTLANGVAFGHSVVAVGDLDGDGVTDLAVGTSGDDTGGTDRGAVYILLMNSDGSVKINGVTKIANALNGGPTLTNSDLFGRSLAVLGDVTSDQVTELVIGAQGDDTGGTDRGAIYFMSLKQFAITTSGPTSVTENVALNTVVGNFTTAPADPPNTYTFSLVSGTGATNNSSFTLSMAGVLQTAAAIDYETTPTLSIRVRTTRQDGVFTEGVFIINVIDVADATAVTNRRLFYNRSTSLVFGNGAGNPTTAIDTDKVALLPVQTSAFANYSNYTRGINGLIIDVSGTLGTPTASDFVFATWDGINVAGFVASAAVPTVSIIPGGGVSGETRIKIEFADNDIRNTWLRTTVLGNANTGLANSDVFYFGNAVGDMNVGNVGSPVTVRTNATDTSSVRQNQSPGINSVGVTNIYDLNKDGRVNSTDTSAVRQNQVSSIIRHFMAPAALQLAATIGPTTSGLLSTPSIGSASSSSSQTGSNTTAVARSIKVAPATLMDFAAKPPAVRFDSPVLNASSGNSDSKPTSSDSSSLAACVDKFFATLS